MFDKLGPALRRALADTRAANPAEATRRIQEALGNGASFDPQSAPSRPRKSLGETLAKLREASSPLARRETLEPKIPEGAAFLRRTQNTSCGSRDYRLYDPATHRPRGLIVMLHGCKQNAEDFAIGTAMNAAAEAEGFMVAYPTQTHGANPSACWNWFRPEDQTAERGEPHIIAAMTRSIVAEYALDQSRVFVAGLSAGGAMAAVMAATCPKLYAAAGVHSGLPYGAAHDVPSAFAAMRGEARTKAGSRTSPSRLIVFHGTGDSTVAPRNASLLMEGAQEAHRDARHSRRQFEAGSRRVEHQELRGTDGIPRAELWLIAGAGHHWSGGDPTGSYAKPDGPNASREMLRFFLGRACPIVG